MFFLWVLFLFLLCNFCVEKKYICYIKFLFCNMGFRCCSMHHWDLALFAFISIFREKSRWDWNEGKENRDTEWYCFSKLFSGSNVISGWLLVMHCKFLYCLFVSMRTFSYFFPTSFVVIQRYVSVFGRHYLFVVHLVWESTMETTKIITHSTLVSSNSSMNFLYMGDIRGLSGSVDFWVYFNFEFPLK